MARPKPAPAPGPVTLTGTAGNDVLTGGQRADRIDGLGGDDLISDGDLAPGFRFADLLSGGAGNDTLVSAGGADTIDGGAGTDLVRLLLGSETVAITMTGAFGSGSTAVLGTGLRVSNVEAVVLVTGSGRDAIAGGAGADYLATSLGDDTVAGGAGNDTILAGDGTNQVAGGAGADLFIVETGGFALISDFDAASGDRALFEFQVVDITKADALAGGFLRLVDAAGGAQLQVDEDGAAGAVFGWETVASFLGRSAAAVGTDAIII